MSTHVKNSHWMETVLEEHRQLREMIAEVRKFLDRPRPIAGQPGAHSWASELSRWLVKLHDALFRHFRYEEQSGMAEDISLRHPRVATEVDRLMSEHTDMLAKLKELTADVLEYSEGHAPPDAALRTKLTSILDQLEMHEQAETRMIQKAELQEVGIGD